MRDAWLGRRRGEWVAYLRATHRAAEARRRDEDGMSHGIIPFGAVRMWGEAREQALARALAEPLRARVVGADESGVALSVCCPYCGAEHRHYVLAEGWDPAKAHRAGCGRGEYRMELG